MDRLDDHILLEAYERAKELNLEEDFIQLLREEILSREGIPTKLSSILV